MHTFWTVVIVGVAVWLGTSFYFEYSIDLGKELKGKRVVLCGASTGIGEDLAYLYAKSGAKLVLVSRRQAVLERVQEKCRDLGAAQVEIFPGDLSQINTSKAVIDFSEEKLGGIDHLILNHIISYYTAWKRDVVDLEYATKLVQVDLLSYIYLATYALPALESSHGSVVAVSSAAGLYPSPMTHVYAASKHGLHGFFTALRQDLMMEGSNISISMVPLGLFGSDNAKANALDRLPNILKGTFGDPADAARAIAMAAVTRVREYCYPWVETKLVQWLYMAFPDMVDWLLTYMFKHL